MRSTRAQCCILNGFRPTLKRTMCMCIVQRVPSWKFNLMKMYWKRQNNFILNGNSVSQSILHCCPIHDVRYVEFVFGCIESVLVVFVFCSVRHVKSPENFVDFHLLLFCFGPNDTNKYVIHIHKSNTHSFLLLTSRSIVMELNFMLYASHFHCHWHCIDSQIPFKL